jgi:acylphosphatase
MIQAATLVFHGRFRTESFLEFVRHRAERLALRAAIGTVTPDRIEVSVAGEAELLDAFELACSLGPIDCVVLDHRRTWTIAPGTSGSVPRSGS